MFSKVLIANRGEIARRVLRACRALGIRAAVAHSQPDADCAFVREADEAVTLEGSTAADTYLNPEAILEAARRCRAQAIHPGYGFLSEQAPFARACEEQNLVFIGPRSDTLAAVGDKAQARKLAGSLGIPVIPGFDDPAADDTGLAAAAVRLGLPVLIKAQAGGGGRGIRFVASAGELADAIASARAEARGAFNDDRLYLESLIRPARHVEIQFLGDGRGGAVHLFERECSIQRRNQKLIEESPSPGLPEATRRVMADAALRLACEVRYRGAGTAEFLLDAAGHYYFLEINARIQVEHPVTECVTGMDLVTWQIRLAAGEPLNFRQQDVCQRGHAIECRIYAEDPARHFWPCIGRVRCLCLPEGPHLRCDCGIAAGESVGVLYDPLLLKLVASGLTREEALAKMSRALEDTVLLGVTTNIEFLRQVVAHPAFVQGKLHTGFLEEHFAGWSSDSILSDSEWLGLAAFELLGAPQTQNPASAPAENLDPWWLLDGWRMGIS